MSQMGQTLPIQGNSLSITGSRTDFFQNLDYDQGRGLIIRE